MDHPSEERLGVSLLGEPDPGHARGAVHGWRGNLWGCGVSTLPGKPTDRHTPVAASDTLPMSIYSHTPSLLLFSRRTSSLSGTKLLVTRRPLPASETPCAESSTYLPTPSWSTRRTQTALSMYVSSFYYILFNPFCLSDIQICMHISQELYIHILNKTVLMFVTT